MNNRDKIYEKKARLYPVIITMIIPVFTMLLFITYWLKWDINLFWRIITTIIPSGIITAALSFYLKNVIRTISKWIFQLKFFGEDETYMPTTELLLWKNNRYTIAYKERLHNKVNNKYQVQFHSENEEFEDEIEARKIIAETIPQMRDDTRHDNILFNYNCYYGSIRNAIGGCTLASIILFVLLIINLFYHILPISYVLIVLSFNIIPILFSKPIMKYFGYEYAKKLHSVFMNV